MGHLKNKEEKDMAVGRSVWEVVKGIFIAVGKLLYLTGKLVICLFVPCRKKGIERGLTGALDTGQTVYKR